MKLELPQSKKNKSKKSNINQFSINNFLACNPCNFETFYRNSYRNTLYNFFIDILELIEVEDERISTTKIYDIELKNLKEKEVTLFELIVQPFISGRNLYLFEINGVSFFSFESNINYKIKPQKTWYIDAFFGGGVEYEIKTLFELLFEIYTSIKKDIKLNNKLILFKNELNTTFLNIPQANRDAFLKDAEGQLESILSRDFGLLDAGDRLSAYSMNTSPLREGVNFVYSELSRILKIPKSKLMGESPAGFSSGNYELEEYGRLLNAYISSYLDPLFKNLDIKYKKKTKKPDLEALKEIGNILVRFDITLTKSQQKKIAQKAIDFVNEL